MADTVSMLPDDVSTHQLVVDTWKRIRRLEKRIAMLSTQDAAKVQDILDEVDGLSAKMDTIAGAIPSLTQQLADAKTALDSMTTQDAADQAALATARQNLDAATQTVSDFEAAADTIKGHTDAVNTHADSLLPTPQP